jgi:hypothetical protein
MRFSPRRLRRELALDADALAELSAELVQVQRVALREADVLVWAGEGPSDAQRPTRDWSARSISPTPAAPGADGAAPSRVIRSRDSNAGYGPAQVPSMVRLMSTGCSTSMPPGYATACHTNRRRRAPKSPRLRAFV